MQESAESSGLYETIESVKVLMEKERLRFKFRHQPMFSILIMLLVKGIMFFLMRCIFPGQSLSYLLPFPHCYCSYEVGIIGLRLIQE